MESLKAFMTEVRGVGSDVKNKIISLIGKTTWEDQPSLTMEELSDQVENITGETTSSIEPVISLKEIDVFIKKNIGGDTTIHGITAWGNAAADLGVSSPGSATTISRGDHVHKMPSASNVGAMATTHPANAITGFSSSTAGLGIPNPGSSDTVARGDHIHKMPTAIEVGALSDSSAASEITGFATATSQLGSPSAGILTKVSRGDHVHKMPTIGDIGAAPIVHTHSYAGINGNISNNFNANQLVLGTGTIFRGSSPTIYSSRIIMGTGSNAALHCNDLGLYSRNTANTDWSDIWARDYYASGVKVASDPRLKKNIIRGWESPTNVNIQEFAYNAVLTYHLKNDPDDSPMRHGFDAKLIRDYSPRASVILPEKDADGNDLYGIDPIAIIAYLTQVIAEQDRRIEKLEIEQIKINK